MDKLITFIPLLILLLTVISTVVVLPKKLAQLSNQERVAVLKEELLKLFLLAEKQEWPGKDKMIWVIAQVSDSYLATIITTITDKPFDVFIQEMYAKFMSELSEKAHLLDEAKKLEETINE